MRLTEVLKIAGANEVSAVQVGGAAGQMIGRSDFERTICYDDLSTGGSLVVFGPDRNVVEIARDFLSFFVHESCGYCTPCRVGNVLLKERLDRILDGKGEPGDLDYLHSLSETIKTASRCGLGQTSPNPVLSTLTNFRDVYESLVKPREGSFKAVIRFPSRCSGCRRYRRSGTGPGGEKELKMGEGVSIAIEGIEVLANPGETIMNGRRCGRNLYPPLVPPQRSRPPRKLPRVYGARQRSAAGCLYDSRCTGDDRGE